eukprot:CAMPEP_0172300564 /NCGR_PEP_ID=MMETSP1058-20130122/2629_1 /TAXON_ID=83371 /ORGANISM="Detonula confervacea, Strain CCMP 353" /LENGTH=628 /DNA_ID=CAMNT_0013010383 /DNA_START=61 /DNA_END=1947 /DNA_ORIENTATION=+
MKSLLPLIAAATVADLVQGQYVCDIPTNGCKNGMFNQGACECECIPPFCHDRNMECNDATKTCDDPWAGCERGVDCPWWANPQKAESCTTGPMVPLGLYQIYSSKSVCCKATFSYSQTCDAEPKTTQPTKYPTISPPEGDDMEVIPLSMEVTGLGNNVNCNAIVEQMLTVTKRTVLRAQDRVPGLKVSEVESKPMANCNLSRRIDQYFSVHVVRDDDKKFGPIIIQDFRDSEQEIIEEIQAYTDTNFFGVGEESTIGINFCTTRNGKYDLCMIDKTTPPPVRAPTPALVQSYSGDEGLAGWVIALIVIFVLLLLCCIGYIVFVSCFKSYDDTKEVHNNIYMDDRDRDSGYEDRRLAIMDDRRPAIMDDRRLAIMDDRSRASGYGDERLAIKDDRSRASGYTSRRSVRSQRQIVLTGQQEPTADEDSFTINTYGTKGKKQRQARDPTMYMPGQEDRPDPASSVRSIGSRSSRRYLEDPPLKPKRDPTMYVEGHYGAEDPPLKPKRDPTMYVEGQLDPSIYGEEASVGTFSVGRGKEGSVGYGSDPYGMGGIEEDDEYDQYGFSHSELDAEYMTSETNAEHVRGRRDPSYYDDPSEVVSVRTQDPSVSGKSGRSKQSKSKKSKTSSRTRG